jgi:hypothetical protein
MERYYSYKGKLGVNTRYIWAILAITGAMMDDSTRIEYFRANRGETTKIEGRKGIFPFVRIYYLT